MFTESLSRRAVRRIVSTVDAVAAPHGIDRFLEQVVPTWSTTEVRGRVVDVDRRAAGSVVLTIEANGGWTGFRAGQYTQLTVEIDGVRHTRSYSMASAADGGRRFQLGIKAQAHGLVSQHLLAHAEPGLVVGLTTAAGDFHLPDTRPDRLLLISGGSGITPVLSMLRTLCAEDHAGPITFLHYASEPDAVLFAAELAELDRAHANVRVLTAFDQEPEAGDLQGLLDTRHLDAADPRWRDAETYVCGPPPLMDAVRRELEAAGASDRFHQEAFTLPQLIGEASDVAGTLRFATSDHEVASDGRPILEQAEAAGLSPQSGCRMGICHTCVRSLRCGTVRDLTSGELTTESPTGPGTDVRICINAPVGDVDIDL